MFVFIITAFVHFEIFHLMIRSFLSSHGLCLRLILSAFLFVTLSHSGCVFSTFTFFFFFFFSFLLCFALFCFVYKFSNQRFLLNKWKNSEHHKQTTKKCCSSSSKSSDINVNTTGFCEYRRVQWL